MRNFSNGQYPPLQHSPPLAFRRGGFSMAALVKDGSLRQQERAVYKNP